MPVTMGGIASGINTDEIIQKLVGVENQKITKAQRDKSENQSKKKALQSYSSLLSDLQKSVKELYGFRASYDDKKSTSSNPALLDAVASKLADKGVSKLMVTSLASSHKISTDPVDSTADLPAGQFEIEIGKDNRPVKFRGGNITKLKEKFDEALSGVASVSSVNTDGKNQVITIESKTPGKDGELKIRGDKDFLKKIGLVKGERNEESDRVNFVFDNRYFSNYSGEKKIENQDGSLAVAPDGKSVSLGGVLWREYVLPVPAEIKKESVLQLGMQYQQPKKDETDDSVTPYKVETGPDRNTVIKGIELHGYKISRERAPEPKPKKPVFEEILGVGVVTDENGTRKEKMYKVSKDSKGVQEFPIGSDFEGKKISRVIFYCNEGNVTFSDGSISTPLDKKGLLDPKNTISEAKDAKLKVDGVDITRNKNDGLSDIIKGVTLSLKGASEKEEVTITVDNDIAASIKKINTFIDNYNKYLDVTNQMMRTAKMKNPGDYEKMKDDTGYFIGDMTLIRLENQLKTTVGSAFPSRVETPIKTLPQVGISTGKLNASWESIKGGKLQLDDAVLREAIMKNPEGVKDLFGSDNDGDNRTDNGFAFVFENVLEPYVRPGKNIMATKIDLEDEAMKRNDEYIAQQTSHIKTYEDKLRQKFATMEKSVTQSRGQQNWMKQQMGSSGQ